MPARKQSVEKGLSEGLATWEGGEVGLAQVSL